MHHCTALHCSLPRMPTAGSTRARPRAAGRRRPTTRPGTCLKRPPQPPPGPPRGGSPWAPPEAGRSPAGEYPTRRRSTKSNERTGTHLHTHMHTFMHTLAHRMVWYGMAWHGMYVQRRPGSAGGGRVQEPLPGLRRHGPRHGGQPAAANPPDPVPLAFTAECVYVCVFVCV